MALITMEKPQEQRMSPANTVLQPQAREKSGLGFVDSRQEMFRQNQRQLVINNGGRMVARRRQVGNVSGQTIQGMFDMPTLMGIVTSMSLPAWILTIGLAVGISVLIALLLKCKKEGKTVEETGQAVIEAVEKKGETPIEESSEEESPSKEEKKGKKKKKFTKKQKQVMKDVDNFKSSFATSKEYIDDEIQKLGGDEKVDAEEARKNIDDELKEIENLSSPNYLSEEIEKHLAVARSLFEGLFTLFGFQSTEKKAKVYGVVDLENRVKTPGMGLKTMFRYLDGAGEIKPGVVNSTYVSSFDKNKGEFGCEVTIQDRTSSNIQVVAHAHYSSSNTIKKAHLKPSTATGGRGYSPNEVPSDKKTAYIDGPMKNAYAAKTGWQADLRINKKP